jgi:hypothetical protein
MNHKPEKPFGYKVPPKVEASKMEDMGAQLKKKLEMAQHAKKFEANLLQEQTPS